MVGASGRFTRRVYPEKEREQLRQVADSRGSVLCGGLGCRMEIFMNTIRDLIASIKAAVREFQHLRRVRRYRESLDSIF
jgi:hypothetical protein